MWKSRTVEVGLSDKQGIDGIFLEVVWDDAGPGDVNFWFGIDAGAGVTSAAGPGDSDLTPLTLVSGHYDITGDRNVDAILIGSEWDTLAQTFSFPTDGAFYVGYTTGENVNGFSVFNAAQQTAARYALGLVSQYSNMVFTEITETATVHADHRQAFGGPTALPQVFVDVDLPQADDGAVFIVRFHGNTQTKSTGVNGPVVIHSRTVTNFVCTRQVHFDRETGFVAAPCKVVGQTKLIHDRFRATRNGIGKPPVSLV
jgi:hypothetical protein